MGEGLEMTNKLGTKLIKAALHEEKEAIKDYTAQAKKVDSKTAKLFRHIASEERHHKAELAKRLKAIRK